MARPYKDGMKKAIIVSVSLSPETKEYLDKNNLSPSKLFQELFIKYINAPKEEPKKVSKKQDSKRKEILDVLDYLKVLYAAKLKPSNDYLEKEKHFEQVVKNVLEKFPMLTKALIYSYIERESGYFELPEEVKEDSNGL